MKTKTTKYKDGLVTVSPDGTATGGNFLTHPTDARKGKMHEGQFFIFTGGKLQPLPIWHIEKLLASQRTEMIEEMRHAMLPKVQAGMKVYIISQRDFAALAGGKK